MKDHAKTIKRTNKVLAGLACEGSLLGTIPG